jgi:hypothetical protein
MEDQNLIEIFITFLDDIYFKGAGLKLLEHEPEKFQWELAEFMGWYT